MMAEAMIMCRETIIEKILAELYRGIIKKNMWLENTPEYFETYNSRDIKEISIEGEIKELEIKKAFNNKVVIQQNSKTKKIILYIPVDWNGTVILENQPSNYIREDKLERSAFCIISPKKGDYKMNRLMQKKTV